MKLLKTALLSTILLISDSQAEVSVTVNSPIASTTTQAANPNAPTLAQMTKPSDSQLSQANQQLLAKNTELQREIDSLNAQVGVLTHDFSGQLFIYGAFTALLSFIAGAMLSFFVLGRKRGW
ncbi:hypothetical protein MOMA_07496 [Moraxella macacae 0408225]|uniref:SH3 domain protein n=1 Tax=Moraxella macacae 0408225 TaxID=1230338 RepID=L2F5S8_9GAMM|nr:hypothetical protein [Moraxella macacae]ELA08387.1 hypothetical protein MOMA_07496 [Moraxella macacae 0408225]